MPDSRNQDALEQGQEAEIAILFADLRGFTGFSEHKLPYDVVYILNQYFELMGHAIESQGGRVDKFIGDGIMALFGLQDGIEKGCLHGLRAIRGMQDMLIELNKRVKHDLNEPLDMGIALHCGQVIVGRMGYGEATGLTAIGDAVNTASRMESATREYNCRVIISEDVATKAGIAPEMEEAFPAHTMSVRGRAQPLKIYTIENPSRLPIPGQPIA